MRKRSLRYERGGIECVSERVGGCFRDPKVELLLLLYTTQLETDTVAEYRFPPLRKKLKS
jgi:hypothetical protein